jgi:hypothetical protein
LVVAKKPIKQFPLENPKTSQKFETAKEKIATNQQNVALRLTSGRCSLFADGVKTKASAS